MILRGPYSKLFWSAVVGLGHVAPLLLLVLIPGAPLGVSLVAGILSLIGLLIFEHIWVIAGQSVPLS
jgi:formate-dependent nitrite reductase membrane component NrfD